MAETPEQKLRAYLEKATAALKSTKQKLQELENRDREPIAIVGMGCRYPGGVETPEQLWNLVEHGVDAVSGMPDNRGWDLANLYDPDPERAGRSISREGGFLHEAPLFDPAFFEISPREALMISPQQRLLLATSWEAMERAGILPHQLRGSATGVFVGVMYYDYGSRLEADPESLSGYAWTGSAGSVSSGRISYTFGFEGPSITVDTACSSSLVAIHLASQSLRRGECSLALAGGVTVMATPSIFIEFSRLRALSPDGRCKAFSDSANGVGWAEGAGMLVLERLSDARANGHPVLAVIRGSAINQDGRSQGLTAPNGPAQRRVIQAALANAELTPADIDIVEAHGTGTKLGDPIEANALQAVYGRARSPGSPLWLGSLKSNIGHTQAAAGVGGMIKMVLAMQHRVMPRSLYCELPTTQVDWSSGQIALLSAARDWTTVDAPRRAGVSSFGISGTNAHLIIEEAPELEIPATSTVSPAVALMPFSGKTATAVRAYAGRLAAALADVPLRDFGVALTQTRTHFEHRAVLVARDHDQARAALQAFAAGEPTAAVVEAVARADCRLAVLFTGQGSQRVGMGRELHAAYPRFRAAFDDVCAQFDRLLDRPLREVVFAQPDSADATLIDQTRYTQPALFAIEVALYRLVESMGVRAEVLLGHSIGELVAAHIAGILSLADACKLVEARARLMQALPEGGAMVSIQASEQEVREAIARVGGQVDIAGLNGPQSTVVSGDEQPVLTLAQSFEQLGRKTRRLTVSHAFHSSRMEPMLAAFRQVAASLEFSPPAIPIVSNVTGKLAGADELRKPEYWVSHVRQGVRFLDGVHELEREGVTTMLELGPHGVLCAMASECLPPDRGDQIGLISALRREQSELDSFALALGQLHCEGVQLDWAALLGDAPKHVLPLPTYPFDLQSYWIEPRSHAVDLDAAGLGSARHPLLGAQIVLADTGTLLLTGSLSVASHPWLAEHVVHGQTIVPGTLFIELAGIAVERLGLTEIVELVFEAPLRLPDRGAVTLQAKVDADDGQGLRSLTIHSRPSDESGDWILHAKGLLGRAVETPNQGPLPWPPRDATAIDLVEAYSDLERRGLRYGASFRGISAAWTRADEHFVEVRLPEGLSDEGFDLHPALLDAALHPLALVGDDSGRVALPFAWAGVRIHATGAKQLRVHISRAAEGYRLDARDGTGARVLTAERLSLRAASAEELRAIIHRPPSGALQRIDWQASPLGSPPSTTSWVAIAARDFMSLPTYPSLAALQGKLDGGGSVPAFVVASLEEGTDPIDATVRTSELIRGWLADERLGATALVLISHQAIATHAAEPVHDLVHAPIWGLGRTVRSEHPERRLQLVDIDAAGASMQVLAMAIAGGEPELALRDGAARVPRLANVAVGHASTLALGDGTVLITGGTGALGGEIARHLVEHRGARSLLLCSRRGPAAAGAAELQAKLEAAGASVMIVASDLGERDAVNRLLHTRVDGRPITAIIHVAGVLDDGLFGGLTRERIVDVFMPKVVAGALLDECSRDLNLQAFVLFSSISGLIGNAGQSSYAAANSYLDALASHRRASGRPGLSLVWGPWAGAGMAADLDAAALARLRRKGLIPLEVAEGLALFDAALNLGSDAVLVATRFDTGALRQDYDALAPLLRGLVGAPPRRVAKVESFEGLAAELATVSAQEREHVLAELIAGEAGSILGLAHGVAHERPLQELGLDSLMAVELRNRLQKRANVRLPATLVFDYPTVKALTTLLLQELKLELEPRDARPSPSTRERPQGDDPIVIVAMACRYPGGVHSPEQLWELVTSGRDAILEFPRDRGWDVEHLFHPDPDHSGTSVSREGGFLLDAADFDAGFFGISPREASSIDPQQRLLLETSWEALERAGIRADALRGTQTGVFVGIMYSDYGSRLFGTPESLEGYVAIGSAPSVASGRIAYSLGLEGPALTVDTACSSSLVAVHLAAQALRNHECDLALVGGATVMATPTVFIEFSRQRGLAPDGRCKSYSDAADGVGWAEGAGMLVLERMSDAKAKQHPILAVVRGSAVNQDGRSQGLTAPNGPSQQRVIRAALADAGISARDVDLIEGHGTGTRLGDPIEIQALQATYGREHTEGPIWLGSVKSNIGHTQAAAGVAGIIKAVLALQHDTLPGSLHADHPSTAIEWPNGGVQLLAAAQPWVSSGRPRRAAVSSFGISGTNAHVIIEQAPAAEPASRDARSAARPLAFVISARTDAGVAAQAARLRAYLEAHSEVALDDVAWSLLHSRTMFERRAAIVAAEREQLLAQLPQVEPVVAKDNPRVAVLFTGQGAQRRGMGRQLMDAHAVFADTYTRVFAAFRGHLELPLDEVMFPEHATIGDLIHQTAYTQPALFALEVALYRLFESWGLRVDLLLGHSIGEIVAAHVAGVMSLEDACTLVAARARLMQALPGGGAMVSIQATEDEVSRLLERHPEVDIAAINGPMSTVISGDEDTARAVAAHFESLGRKTTRLSVSHAFHSRRMEPMLAEFRAVVAGLSLRPPTIPIISNVTGQLATAEELTNPEYWVRHVRDAVRFLDGMRALEARGVDVCLELGPHGMLTSMAAGCLNEDSTVVLLPSLRRDVDEAEAVAAALGSLSCHGVALDWQTFFSAHQPRVIELPTYPFQRQRYWLDVPESTAAPKASRQDGFWAAVERQDEREFLDLLGADERGADALRASLSLLGKWYQTQRQIENVGTLRYAVRWRVWAPPSSAFAKDRAILIVRSAGDESGRAVSRALGIDESLVVELQSTCSRSELREVLARALARHNPSAIVSLLALDEHPRGDSASLPTGVASNLLLTQALADIDTTPRLWFMTQGAVATLDSEPLPNPLQAMTWGLYQTAALELPRRIAGILDLPADLGDTTLQSLARVLESNDAEDQFALRGGNVYVRRLVRAPHQRPAGEAFQPRGSILITGGTGALGAKVARWLAERGAKRLILTSRRGAEAPGARALVREIEAMGVDVSIVACDIADKRALEELLTTIHTAESPLRAVFHIAGVLDDALVTNLDLERFATPISPKVGPALALDELTRSMSLDAFVLFTSATGVIGNVGQANYAAANAALDALAQRRRSMGLPATSLAWGAWAGEGMAAAVAAKFENGGIRAMSSETALDAMSHSLGTDNWMIADIDWARVWAAHPSYRGRRLFSEFVESAPVTAAPADSTFVDELKELQPRQRQRRIVDLVMKQTVAVLGLNSAGSVAPGTGFGDLGLDSLMAVELRQRLKRETGLELPATITFDHPTPERLAGMLERELQSKLGPADEDDPVKLVSKISPTMLESSGVLRLLRQLAAGQTADVVEADEQDDKFDDLDDDDLLDAAGSLLGDLE